MRIQKNGANMNQNVVTTMLWRVAQNCAAFVKVIEMYLYNYMIVLSLYTFSRNGSWQEIKPYFLGCESDSECRKIGFYACVGGSCVRKYPQISQLRLINLGIYIRITSLHIIEKLLFPSRSSRSLDFDSNRKILQRH